MAKNLGREFATMTEDERRRFALEHPDSTDELPAELEFEDPRAEVAEPEQRDQVSTQVDDDEHGREIEEGK